MEPRLAATAAAETDVCLCTVVVLNKHCSTRAHTYVFIFAHTGSVCFCFAGQAPQFLRSKGPQLHIQYALCLCCRTSCGLTSRNLCTPGLLDPHKKTLRALDFIFVASTYWFFRQMGRKDGRGLFRGSTETGRWWFSTDNMQRRPHARRAGKCLQGRTCTSTVGRCHHKCQFKLYQRALTSSKESNEQQTLVSHVAKQFQQDWLYRWGFLLPRGKRQKMIDHVWKLWSASV